MRFLHLIISRSEAHETMLVRRETSPSAAACYLVKIFTVSNKVSISEPFIRCTHWRKMKSSELSQLMTLCYKTPKQPTWSFKEDLTHSL